MPDLIKIADRMRAAAGKPYRAPLMRMHELEAVMALAEHVQATAPAVHQADTQ